VRAPVRIDFPYLISDVDRHGTRRYYVRRGGKKVRVRQKLGTEGFAQAYVDARHALDHGEGHAILKGAPAGSFGWLAASYFVSTEFKALGAKSQVTRRLVIEGCLREPLKPASRDLMRNCPISALAAKHVKMLVDRRAGQPGAANNRRKYLSAMLGWAVQCGLVRSNVARDVRRVAYASDGFHTWTVDEVRQFETKHPIGSKARLAMALMLYLGVRRGDVVTLGRQHVKGDWVRMVPLKTRYRRQRISEKPILPVLAGVIAGSPVGNMTFLVTAYGKPFTANGFGSWFRDRCNEAGLPHCTAHGLRKAGATIAAENGATDRMLMALYDWETANQATAYTRAADRKRLAGEAASMIATDQSANAAHRRKVE
jgi:integrase